MAFCNFGFSATSGLALTRSEENFDETTKQLFDRYTQLTNKRTSDQQKRYFEELTIKADNALVNEAKRQERIEQIEKQLREEYEVAETNRQLTFDMLIENLWTRYGELVNAETVSNLREECENLVLTANEIDRLMTEEETKERIKQIDAELKRLYSQTRMSRKLDFDYTVDNLFDELSRLKEVDDMTELRRPYKSITDEIENRLALEREQKENEIEETKVNLRNQYLTLKRNRRETFSITTGFIFSKLVTLIGYNQADEFRVTCINEHEELETTEINKLGIEFMEISRKPTKERRSTADRKQEIVTLLMNRVPRRELNNMIDEGIKVERQVQERERLMQQQQQRKLAGPRSGNNSRDSREMKESKQQDSLGLPIPQAQRENGQQRRRRPSIEMIVTFDEGNGSEHIGQSSEASKSRSITPVEQPGSTVETVEIEASKEKSKTPIILDTETEEKKKSESEPAIVIENIERKERKEEKKTVSQPIASQSPDDNGSNGSESTRETDTTSDISIKPAYIDNKGWLINLNYSSTN